MIERDIEGRTPAEERAEIGTPAGETPEKGRTRHGESVMTQLAEAGEDTDMDIIEELGESGAEVSTTGGITGTHVHGGTPAGGSNAGGTPTGRGMMHSGDYKKARRG